jgi:hypothetical protein
MPAVHVSGDCGLLKPIFSAALKVLSHRVHSSTAMFKQLWPWWSSMLLQPFPLIERMYQLQLGLAEALQ